MILLKLQDAVDASEDLALASRESADLASFEGGNVVTVLVIVALVLVIVYLVIKLRE